VVAVPADTAAHVEQDFRHELQHRRDFIGERLGGVIVAGVEAVELLVVTA